jgi:predicted transcriptional regulator
LVEHGFVGPKQGDVYTVTKKGHDFAKTLDKDPLVDIFN